jgi:hypothetical protein
MLPFSTRTITPPFFSGSLSFTLIHSQKCLRTTLTISRISSQLAAMGNASSSQTAQAGHVAQLFSGRIRLHSFRVRPLPP